MPFGWGESEDAYNQVNESEHTAKFSHELLAGAASFGAFKMFEDRQRQEGKPVSHQFAKELLAGFAGAEADKLVETKGEDYIDAEKAKWQAQRNAEHMYDEHYVRGLGADEYNPDQYNQHESFNRY